MTSIGEEWKQTKQQVGKMINHLDGLYKEAENLDELTTKAEQRGYKKGYTEGHIKNCEACSIKNFHKSCNGHFLFIEQFLSLKPDEQAEIKRLVNILSNK